MSVNGTLAEAKMCTFTLESKHFIFNECPIYTHDGASAKFSTNSQKTVYSVVQRKRAEKEGKARAEERAQRGHREMAHEQDRDTGQEAEKQLWGMP